MSDAVLPFIHGYLAAVSAATGDGTPRMLAVDLDGTLLTSQRQIHPASGAALLRARDAGIEVVLATGRLLTSMKPFADELGLPGPFICCNGAHVVGESEEIFHATMDPDVVRKVSEYALAHRVHLNVYARTEVFFLFDSPWGDLYVRRASIDPPKLLTPEMASAVEASKMVMIDSPTEIPRHATALAAILQGSEYRFTESEPEYLDILSPNADKGIALRLLARLRGIDRTDVAAIGDYLNDLEMIRFAGKSAAIGNAVDAVKASANSVVASNDDAGVAEFVDSIMINRRQ